MDPLLLDLSADLEFAAEYLDDEGFLLAMDEYEPTDAELDAISKELIAA